MSSKYPTIRYNDGVPDCSAIFLAAVPWREADGSEHEFLCDDIILYYGPTQSGEMCWQYVGSDALYRGTVFGWIGPLERMTQRRIEEKRKEDLPHHGHESEDVFDV